MDPYSHVRWVNPRGERRTKSEWPYSYSEFFIWGTPQKGDEAVYTDRLCEWSAQKNARLSGAWERAWKAVSQRRFDQFAQKDADKFMSAYEGKPLTVTAIAEGCNVSSGYPY